MCPPPCRRLLRKWRMGRSRLKRPPSQPRSLKQSGKLLKPRSSTGVLLLLNSNSTRENRDDTRLKARVSAAEEKVVGRSPNDAIRLYFVESRPTDGAEDLLRANGRDLFVTHR